MKSDTEDGAVRAVIYAAKSTADVRGSIPTQLDDCRAAIEREGQAYARENLTFALLEFWSMRTADDHVIEREQYWKEVLLTREFGHNKN